MDSHTLRVLEFGEVLEATASLAATPLGAAAVSALAPIADRRRLDEELDRLEEMVRFLAVEPGLDMSGLNDIEPFLPRIEAEGAFLDPEELETIHRTVACLARLKGRLEAAAERCPLLAEMGSRLGEHRELLAAFRKTFGPGLTIADSASPELKRIRRRLTGLKDSIRAELETIISAKRSQGLLQDEIITQRSGRFVLPVKSSRQGDLSGIIHDSSASRQTVYMEPLAVTGLNNQLGLMTAEERREVVRILTRLTEMIRPLVPELTAQIELAAELDSLQARARFAARLKAVKPELDDEGRLELKAARHPLLILGPGEAVPVDLAFPEDRSILIVSGPNAGGKTVALKTMGLLCVMAHSGFFVPAAEGSRLPFLSGLAASIGDDQAIAAGESTFSARLGWLKRVLDEAGEGWLVLIDELGGGTDPAEGAALGLAALDRLADQGAKVLATTHLNFIKAWAAANERALNASVLIDQDSRRPTYELAYGRPGLSNAFEMADSVGLDRELTARARRYLGGEEERFKTILTELTRLDDDHRRARAEIEAERRKLEARQAEAKRLRRALERDRERLIEEERARLNEMLAKAEAALERILARADTDDVRARDRAKYRFYGEKSRLKAAFGPAPGRPETPPASGFKAGQAVKVAGFAQPGVVEADAPPGRKVKVRLAGGMRVTTDPAEVAPTAAPPEDRRPRATVGPGPSRSSLRPEIKIIGLRVDEALPVVDKALDDALLSGVDKLAIVHGVGTGALRSAVREFLAGHPRVRCFGSAPGIQGPAVTEVELRA